MVAGTCSIELHIPASNSLKSKRAVLQSLMARARHEFNVAIAEVEHQDKWQTAGIAAVSVSTDGAYLHGLFEKLVAWIERERPDLEVLNYHIEYW
jgi:uncharacterized protein YlxP (DUF503 family)